MACFFLYCVAAGSGDSGKTSHGIRWDFDWIIFLTLTMPSTDTGPLFNDFDNRLKEKGFKVEHMSADGDWKKILSELGFDVFQTAALLKTIHVRTDAGKTPEEIHTNLHTKSMRIFR